MLKGGGNDPPPSLGRYGAPQGGIACHGGGGCKENLFRRNACGGGKVLLSELPGALLDQLFSTYKMEALTPYTITDPVEYRKVLHETAKNGYAIDFQESSINGSCIAVPVRDKEGTIIASLSFSGLIGIADPAKLLKYVPILKEASAKITSSLYDCWEL